VSGSALDAGTLSVDERGQYLVTLASVEDDGLGEELQALWDLEPGARTLDRALLPTPDPGRLDEPATLDAFLDAVRWGAVTNPDARALQAPFRSGITLGGLVGLGEPESLGGVVGRALEQAALCTSDPMCAEHDPTKDGSLHGAACHACLFASETSCERGNRYLDRTLLVETFADASIGFFS